MKRSRTTVTVEIERRVVLVRDLTRIRPCTTCGSEPMLEPALVRELLGLTDTDLQLAILSRRIHSTPATATDPFLICLRSAEGETPTMTRRT